MVDAGAVAQGGVAHGVAHDLLDLSGTIAQLFQRRGDRLVDDLEIAAARQLLELDQREIRLDARGVAIHDQADRAGGRDDRGLGVTEAVRLPQSQRLVPRRAGQVDQGGVGTVRGVQRHGGDVHALARRAMRRGAVVADDAQHVVGVAGIAGERAQFGGHPRAGGIGGAGHDRRQRPADRAALIAVIAQAHVHQQTADIGIAQPKRAKIIAALRDFLGRELRHQHADLQRDGPQPAGMDIGVGVEPAIFPEGQQVHGRQVAGGVVQEHVFAARVRPADRPVLGAGVPGVDRVVELDARIGAGPGRVADLVPQIARRHGLGDLAVGAADQLPRGILAHGAQEGVRHPDRVVRVLARHRHIGLGIPVRVIGRKFDAVEALPRILQHAVHIGVRDHRAFGAADRGLQRVVPGGIGLSPTGADRGKDAVQFAFVQLGPGDQGRDLLLLDHLPVHEGFDVGMVHVADDHLGRAARGAARLDRARSPVADLQEPHQARRLAAAGQLFPLAAQRREIGAGAAAVLEQARLADPQVHDAALVHQIVADRLDEAGMRLRMLIGAGRCGQLTGLVVDIEMPLPRPVDAIGPVQAGVEPLRAVRRGHLAGQHVAHLVQIGAGIGLGREIAALPAPIGPGPGQTVKDLTGAGLSAEPRVFGQIGHRGVVGNVAPQEFGHALFADGLQARGDAGAAKVFLGDDVAGDLAPALGHLDRVVAKDHRAVRIADLAEGGGERDAAIGPAGVRGKAPLDLHPCPSFRSPARSRNPPVQGASARGRPSDRDCCDVPVVAQSRTTTSCAILAIAHKLPPVGPSFN